MSFVLTKNANNFAKYIISGYVEQESEVASLSTSYTLGSIIQAIDTGKVYILLESGWTHLPTLQDKVDTLMSVKRFIGVTTTELETGSTVNPILINGISTTAVDGDVATYEGDDFVYNGEIWQEAFSALGLLAYKDSASGTYTPQGTITPTKTTATVAGVTSAGTLPTLTYDAQDKSLTFDAGTLPTTANETVVTDISATFVGTQATITVE